MRFADWQQRLDQAIKDAKHKAFAWGSWDCCLFAADVVLAITGDDPAAVWRGTYTDEAGANEIIAEHGSLQELVTSEFGDPVHVSRAMRGDLVVATLPLITGAEDDCLGVCLGVHSAFPVSRGLRYVRTSTCRLAWSVF